MSTSNLANATSTTYQKIGKSIHSFTLPLALIRDGEIDRGKRPGLAALARFLIHLTKVGQRHMAVRKAMRIHKGYSQIFQ